MTVRSPGETFVHSHSDLLRLWREFMGPGGFAQRSLWTIFIEDRGQLSRVVVPIDDLPDEPDARLVRNFAWILQEAIEPPVRSAAFLLSRPGPGHMLASDRRWARALRDSVSPSLAPWPMHLATAGRVQVFAPDDLVAA